MRLLWLKSDFPLPADTGGKIRTLMLMQELQRLAQVDLLCYAPPSLDGKWKRELTSRGIAVETVDKEEEVKSGPGFLMRVLGNIASPRPYIVNKYRTREMEGRVRSRLASGAYDVLLCDFLDMAWYGLQGAGVPVVLFEHNVETMIWQRYWRVERHPLKKLYFGYEQHRVARFEREACRSVDLVLAVSDEDGDRLQSEFGARKCLAVPTGVDSDYFSPHDCEVPGNLVFCGSMDWMPNVDGFWWFYRSILPRIEREVPGVHLTVVGRRPEAAIRAVGEADPRVTVTGTVEDVRPHVAGGQIYIVPLRVGGGTRIKIFEAMAMGKCVVSTPVGAEGLRVVPEKTIVLADGEDDFAAQVVRLLRDGVRRKRIAEEARRAVTEEFSWKRAGEVLYQALSDVGSNGEVTS